MPNCQSKSMQPGKTGSELLEMYYHDVRSHLLEAAAAFDRFECAGLDPDQQPRLQKLRQVAAIVCDQKPNRAQRFLEALSDD